MGTIRKVHANFNPEIKIMGILRVMYDSRITLAQQVSAQLEEHFKEKVFKAVIPRNIRLAEAPSHGLPGVRFDPGSRGALGSLDFASELIERTPAYVAQMKSAAQAHAGQQAAPQARDASHVPAGSTNAPTQADETAEAQNPSITDGSASGHVSETPADSHTEESQANAG